MKTNRISILLLLILSACGTAGGAVERVTGGKTVTWSSNGATATCGGITHEYAGQGLGCQWWCGWYQDNYHHVIVEFLSTNNQFAPGVIREVNNCELPH